MKKSLIASTLSIGLAFVCLSACGSGRTLEWKQEAPLQDGRVLVVERISKQGPSDPFLGSLRMEIEQTLVFQHPDTGARIEWRIPEGLQPAMIDFDRGVPYFVLTAYTVADYNKWDCPNPPYLVYRYQQGTWSRISFQELPPAFANRNLFPMMKDVRPPVADSGILATKGQLNDYWMHFPKPSAAKTISREKVNPIGKGCYPDTLARQNRQAEAKIGYDKQEEQK